MSQQEASRITVAIVSICGARHVMRCLDALAAQEQAPPFDVVLVHDPLLKGMDTIRDRHPHVRIISNEGQRSPLELAARAMAEAEGDLILLTEDHCLPKPHWIRHMVDAQRPGRGAVGGVVQADHSIRPVDWAFYFVDFFRYMRPARAGPSPTLTVCNVSYRREHLEEIKHLWQTFFHETAINDALRDRFGPLWLEPSVEVEMRRTVRFGDAVYERYAFGRLFGCTRLEFCGTARRLYYAMFAPALPILLMGRMGAKAVQDGSATMAFIRALPALTLMVLAWSWGEWLGYVTRRRPRSLVVAPEIRAAERGSAPA